MERKVLWPILVVGLALIIVPFAMSMPSKTAAGQRMLNDFHPLMSLQRCRRPRTSTTTSSCCSAWSRSSSPRRPRIPTCRSSSRH